MDDKIHTKIHTVSIFWDQIQSTIESYLVKGRLNALIDSGPPQSSPDIIARALRQFDLAPQQIDYVLHTHGHVDHIGADQHLKRTGKTKLMIHKLDAPFLDDHRRAFDLFYAMGRDEKMIEQERAAFLGQVAPELAVDRYVTDSDIIDLGDEIRLQVVHIPGHTPGSVGYYWEKEGIMLAGDSVPGLNSPEGALPIIFDFVDYERSIERLMTMNIATLVFCHAYRGIALPPSRIRKGNEVKEYLSDSLELVKRLADLFQRRAIDETGSSTREIADGIIAELPAAMGFKPIAELARPHFTLGTVSWGLTRARQKH